jgi:hypothetical protein
MYSGVPTTMPLCVRPLVSGLLAEHLGDAEVEDLDVLRVVAALDQHDVAGLHVAVDDALVVGGLQRVAHLQRDVADPLPRQRPDSPTICERSLPCRYSITKKGWPSGVFPKSVISTTLGWLIIDADRASRMKRSTWSGRTDSSALRTLTRTS